MTTSDIAGLSNKIRCRATTYNVLGGHYAYTSGDCALDTKAANTLERQAAEIERLRGALTDALPYVVQFEDMRDGIHGAPEPNCAMQLVHEIRAALTGEDQRPAHTAPHLAIVPTPDENAVPIALGDWTPDGAPATLTGKDHD